MKNKIAKILGVMVCVMMAASVFGVAVETETGIQTSNPSVELIPQMGIFGYTIFKDGADERTAEDNWVTYTTLHKYGWGKCENKSHSGNHSYYCSEREYIGENSWLYKDPNKEHLYDNYLDSRMRSIHDFPASGESSYDKIYFWYWLDTDIDPDDDYLSWFYRADGDLVYPEVYPFPGGGKSLNWEEVKVTVDGNELDEIEFIFVSDGLLNDKGAYIDDIRVKRFHYLCVPYPFEPLKKYAGEHLLFDASQSVSSHGIIEYIWDFGDRTVIHTLEEEVEHTYRASGVYTVTLTIINVAGNSATTRGKIIIEYNIPPVVTASPPGGTYDFPPMVTLSVNKAANIYYTLDGTIPTLASPLYISPIKISEATTLKFMAVDEMDVQSQIITETYIIRADISVEMHLTAGWSMISLPLITSSKALSDIFPEALVAYGYKKGVGYKRVEELERCIGYWLLLDKDKSYNLTGKPFEMYSYTTDEDGWQMIGGCTYEAKTFTDNCDIAVIYGYEQGKGYQRIPETECLMPGVGYWALFEDVIGLCELTVEAPALRNHTY